MLSQCIAVIVDDLARPTKVFSTPTLQSLGAASSTPGWQFFAADLSADDDPTTVLNERLCAGEQSVAIGAELTSQIGHWPVDGEAFVQAYYVHLDADRVFPDGQWVAAEDIHQLTWHPVHRAIAFAARNAMIMRNTRPTWSGEVPLPNGRLRQLELGDVADLASLWSHEDLTRNLGHTALTEPQAHLYVRGRLKDATGGSYFPLVIEQHGRVVGEARITLSPRWSCYGATGQWHATVGFAVLPECQGQGIGTAVMRALVQIAFEQLQVAVIRATVFDRSEASAHVMQKVGFTVAGRNPESFQDVDGALLNDDQCVYLRADWLATR